MSFFKKFRRGLGRALKGAARLAITQVPGVGSVGGLVLSKLATAGKNRRSLELAAKGRLVTGVGKESYGTISKTKGAEAYIDPQTMADSLGRAPGPRRSFSYKVEQPKSRLSAAVKEKRELRAKASRLSQDQQLLLYQEWQENGKPGKWEDYLLEQVR